MGMFWLFAVAILAIVLVPFAVMISPWVSFALVLTAMASSSAGWIWATRDEA